MHKQNDKLPHTLQQQEAKNLQCPIQYSGPKKPNALAFDRDKNFFYLASDESIDEVLGRDGYYVVHANRNLQANE